MIHVPAERMVDLARSLSDVTKAELAAKVEAEKLPPMGFTLIVGELGPPGGHIGYISTIDRAGSIRLLQSLLRNLRPERD